MRGLYRQLVLILALQASPALAERNFVPGLENEPKVCVERPSEPGWMQTIGVREAYKRVLVQDIYRFQNMEHIIASRTCACETRFPAWDAAEAEFREHFAAAERWEMLEASDAYNRRANVLRSEAMTICEAVGNW